MYSSNRYMLIITVYTIASIYKFNSMPSFFFLSRGQSFPPKNDNGEGNIVASIHIIISYIIRHIYNDFFHFEYVHK